VAKTNLFISVPVTVSLYEGRSRCPFHLEIPRSFRQLRLESAQTSLPGDSFRVATTFDRWLLVTGTNPKASWLARWGPSLRGFGAFRRLRIRFSRCITLLGTLVAIKRQLAGSDPIPFVLEANGTRGQTNPWKRPVATGLPTGWAYTVI